jgi:mono/diheme cytochrome c family protein
VLDGSPEPAASSGKTAIRRLIWLLSIVIAVGAAWIVWRLVDRDPEISAPDVFVTPSLISKGEYLTRAADCGACHTVPGGQPLAGGVAFKLPFGVIYSSNITADKETGIGTWSDDDFLRALHLGVAKDGSHLYPAFPYTSYTGMSRDDAVAIKAYLFSLSPAHAPAKQNELSFPFNQRWLMAFWNLAFLDVHRFREDPALSSAQNRGTYLATTLGHCGECHTPRNFAFALNGGRTLAGTTLQGWRAYNITPDPVSGIGAWSDAQIADYLKTGHAKDRGSASGPMAEAVVESLQYLTPEDISAIVAYLRQIPPQAGDYAQASSSTTQVSPGAANDLGKRIFDGNCTGCHEQDGRGRQSPYADLIGSRGIGDHTGTNIIQVLLHGADLRRVHPAVFMPEFGNGLSDTELAALANYVIGHFGKTDGTVTPEQIKQARSQ